MKYDYDVIIVGAGPVGLTLANLLSLYDVSVLLLEKHKSLYQAPRAVGLDDESLRIWQQCGLIDKMLPYIAMGKDGDIVFTYKTSSGKPFLSLKQNESPFGYAKGAVFLQNETDKILLNNLNSNSRVDVLFGKEVNELKQTENIVMVKGDDFSFSAKYIVGCDGANSFIRNTLGIKMDVIKQYKNPWLVADLKNEDIDDNEIKEEVQVWCDREFSSVYVPLPLGYFRIEFMIPHDYREEEYLEDAIIKNLVNKRKQFNDIKVIRKAIYKFRAAIAEKYRDNRVFLAGDAAHNTPPFAAQGLASGLRDAANLSWKLAYKIQEKFPEKILDTYEQERKPHQEKMLKLAIDLGNIMMPTNSVVEFTQESVLGAINNINFLKRLIEIRGNNIQPHYEKGFIEKGFKTGNYIIQPILENIKFDDVLGNEFSVLYNGGSPELTIPEKDYALFKQLGAKFVEISKYMWAFEDFLGKYFLYALIRPDKFIYKQVNGINQNTYSQRVG